MPKNIGSSFPIAAFSTSDAHQEDTTKAGVESQTQSAAATKSSSSTLEGLKKRIKNPVTDDSSLSQRDSFATFSAAQGPKGTPRESDNITADQIAQIAQILNTGQQGGAKLGLAVPVPGTPSSSAEPSKSTSLRATAMLSSAGTPLRTPRPSRPASPNVISQKESGVQK